MSMQLLTIMQFAGVFGIYLFLAVLLPALVFYRKFQKEPFYTRFMVYITFVYYEPGFCCTAPSYF